MIYSNEWPPVSGRLLYRPEEYSFDFVPPAGMELQDRIGTDGTASIAIGTLQLEVSITTGVVLFAWGYHPYVSWREQGLESPDAESGCLKLKSTDGLLSGVSYDIGSSTNWRTSFDRATNWVRIQADDTVGADQFVQFASDTIAGLRNEELVELWLHPTFSLEAE